MRRAQGPRVLARPEGEAGAVRQEAEEVDARGVRQVAARLGARAQPGAVRPEVGVEQVGGQRVQGLRLRQAGAGARREARREAATRAPGHPEEERQRGRGRWGPEVGVPTEGPRAAQG